MGRYSLALRPKYGADEKTRGEQMESGIGNAIGELLKYQEAGRQERNTMGAAGATRTADAPGVMDRLRSIGDRLRGTPQRTPSFNPAADDPRAGGAVPPTEIAPPRPSISAALNGAATAGRTFDPAPAASAVGANPMATAPVAVASARPSIGRALDASDDTSYEYEGVHGDRYRVDPQHESRQKLAVQHSEEQRKIQSLIDAGMPEGEARARVLNNVVRYDETFGQYRRPVSSSASRDPEVQQRMWKEREEIRQKNKVEFDRLHAAGRMSSQELQKRRLELEEEAAADRREMNAQRSEREGVKTDIAIASGIDRGIPKDPIARATETDAEKASRQRKEAERDARFRNAGTTADRIRGQRRARQLQKEGKSRDEIARILRSEGIKVTP